MQNPPLHDDHKIKQFYLASSQSSPQTKISKKKKKRKKKKATNWFFIVHYLKCLGFLFNALIDWENCGEKYDCRVNRESYRGCWKSVSIWPSPWGNNYKYTLISTLWYMSQFTPNATLGLRTYAKNQNKVCISAVQQDPRYMLIIVSGRSRNECYRLGFCMCWLRMPCGFQ